MGHTVVGIAAGARFGGYEVDRLLGRGGMADVWLVRHGAFRRPYALKVPRDLSPELADRLVREGVAQSVAHPNVVRAVDLVDLGGLSGLVLEYVDGPTLAQLVERRALSEPELDAIALGLAAGVGAAHAAGLVHRDLKPQNVLLERVGDVVVPRITDFGIARAAEGAGTAAGVALGTPLYMAPEQFRDAAAVDLRADLFSLGCLLYEVCTARRPFAGGSPGALLDAMEAGRYRPLGELRPGLPARMVAAVEACLRPRPDDRPASCAAVLALWQPPDPPPALRLSAEELRRLRTPPAPAAGLLPPWVADFVDGETEDLAGSAPSTGGRLVGRAAELARLRSWLDGGARVVTVKGPGGAGKSRLALDAARAAAGAGVAWCDLADARDDDDVDRALGAVGARARAGGGLLVLDGCDRVRAVVSARMRRWLGEHPDARVLATSREPLRLPGERVLDLPPLTAEDAAVLFAERAVEARPDLPLRSGDPVVRDLVARLDGLPLAIELAAARVATMAPADLLRHLPRLLDPLHGTLAWSWELLTPVERGALVQCTVFRGGFDLPAAEAVVDLGGSVVPIVLDALVQKSLLRSGHAYRFAMLDVVREYGEREPRPEIADAARRHARYFAALPPERARSELDNLAVAARRAILGGEEELAAALALAIGRLLDGDEEHG